MEGESPLFRRGGSLPPNLPLSPRTFPQNPAVTGAKICFAFCDCGVLWESFFVGLGGAGFSAGCGYRTLFVGGKYLRNAFNEPIGCEAAPSKKHLPPKPKTSPKSTRQSKAKQIIAMQGGCSWGKCFCCLGRHGFLAGCGYRTLFVGDTFRSYALHECRQAESWHSRKA